MGARVICLLLTVGFVYVQTVKAQYSECTPQLNDFRQCVRSQMARDQNDPAASESRRQQMEKEFVTCATENGCQSPFPANDERQTRQQCLVEARSSIRQQLQTCVQSHYRDFQLPGDDFEKDAYWNYILLRAYDTMRSLGDNRYNANRGNKQQWAKFGGNQPQNDICGSDDKKKNGTVACLKIKGTFNKTSSQSNWRKSTCRIKRQCNQVTPQCLQQWNNQTKPRVCDCVTTLKTNGALRTIQDQYMQCLRTRGVKNVDQINEDGKVVVQKMLVSWCASGKLNKTQINQSDPCNRQRRPGGSTKPSTSTTTASSAGATVSSASVEPVYDDGTPAQAPDENPFLGMMGGTDMFSSSSTTNVATASTASPTAAPNGGLFGSLLSGFGGGLFNPTSSSSGGGLFSSVFGSGTILGSLLSFTPLDLLSGGFSFFDPNSLTSSMGALGGGGLMSGFGADTGNTLGETTLT